MDTSKMGYRTAVHLLMTWMVLAWEMASGNLYTSIHGLRKLQAQAGQFADKLDNFIQIEEERIKELRRLSSGLRSEAHPGGLYDVEHPIGAFHLIHAWQTLPDVVQGLEVDQDDESGLEVSESDLVGAANALLRLQRSYNLSSELAQGRVRGHQAAATTAAQMEYIGVQALLERDFGLAVFWFEQAVNATPDMNKKMKSRLLFFLGRSHYFIGDFTTAVKITNESLSLDPHNETIPVYLAHYVKKQAAKPTASVTAQTWHRGLNEERTAYEALCRGDRGQGLSPELNCVNRPTRIPYAFVKEEVLSVDPKIMMLHDVISDKDIELLKNLAKDRLFRGLVKSVHKERFGKQEATEERVSKIGWVWDTEYLTEGRSVGHLSELVGMYMGLSATFFEQYSHAEPFQVINYGLGGQYDPHVDYFGIDMLPTLNTPYLEGTGDRMATFMFYLSDVTQGGGTVFPLANVAVPPVKGAAAFWYNVRKSGEMDIRTKHAGCPVLVGEKWVANKWIRERGQENNRPCGLTYDELD